MAEVLAETLQELQREGLDKHKIKLGAIWHADSEAASATARLVAAKLRKQGLFSGTPVCNPLFDPAHASPYSAHNFDKEKQAAIKEVEWGLDCRLSADSNAILVVGHQPMLGVVAQKISECQPTAPAHRVMRTRCFFSVTLTERP